MIEKEYAIPWYGYQKDSSVAESLSPLPVAPLAGAPYLHGRSSFEIITPLAEAHKLIQSGEFGAAREILEVILQREPQHEQALRQFAATFIGQGDAVNGFRCHLVLANQHLNFRNLAELGHSLYALGRDDEAQACYQMALKRPHGVSRLLFEVYKNLGNTFVKQRDLEAAEELYHRGIAIEPTSDVLQVNLGTLEIQKENWEDARTRFRQAVSLNSNNDRAWVGLSLVHRYFGDYDLAWANLQQALSLAPANETAVHLAVDWATQEGLLVKAEQALENYLAVRFNDAAMSLQLARVFLMQGKESLAAIELERALALAPESEEVSEVYWRLRAKARGSQDG